MVILKNDKETFDHGDFVETLYKNKKTDCILYSKEGMKFEIHKEILYQTKLMKNILLDTNSLCCREMEIFCPCTEDDLENMINFFYKGTISYSKQINVVKFIDNVNKIFGFPEKSISIKDASTNLAIKEEFENIDEKHVEIFDEERNVDNTNTIFISLSPNNERTERDPLISEDFGDNDEMIFPLKSKKHNSTKRKRKENLYSHGTDFHKAKKPSQFTCEGIYHRLPQIIHLESYLSSKALLCQSSRTVNILFLD